MVAGVMYGEMEIVLKFGFCYSFMDRDDFILGNLMGVGRLHFWSTLIEYVRSWCIKGLFLSC